MGRAKTTSEDVKREHPLQAVVFADSFTQTFRPITLEKPKVLLPLANMPMLEYTIEFLASAGVQEVIVFCTAHAEEIEEFLNVSSCAKTTDVRCVTSNGCLSAGDAIRELDSMHVIRSDPFILISGDVIANINLKQAIEEHKERKKKDASCIMTMVFKKSRVAHPSREISDDLVVGMDRMTGQLLTYDDNANSKAVSFPTIMFKDHPAISFRYDLLDCHIDICSPDVMVQFSDNFDYQDIRRDFIHNEVQNYELGNKIHAKIVTKDYAARVHDPRTYHSISMDILHRCVYPIVPDNNILGYSTYSYHRNAIYKEKDVALARSVTLKEDTVIGTKTRLDANCEVIRSTIGRNCTIGRNVTIRDSHIWDDVTIEDDVTISNSIICNDATIKKNVTIDRGCIVSFGVIVGEGVHVEEYQKLTLCPKEDDGFGFSDEETTPPNGDSDSAWDTRIVGTDGEGRLWTLDEEEFASSLDDSDDEIEDDKLGYLHQTLIGCVEKEAERELLWDKLETSSFDEDNESLEDFEVESVEDRFRRVVGEMVTSGDTQDQAVEDIFLEIKSYRFAQNRSLVECIAAIIPALLALAQTSPEPMVILNNVKPKLEKWSPVLKKCITCTLEEVAVLNTLEAYVMDPVNKSAFFTIFRYLLQILYDEEVISVEIILKWVHDPSVNKELVEQPLVQEFLEWLNEDSDDDSEEDSD